MRRVCSRLLWIVLATTWIPTAVHAKSLTESIPSEARVVVLLADITKTEAGVRDFAEAAGLPVPFPPLEQILPALNLDGVWDMQRGAAIVGIDPQPMGVALVLPVKNATQALEKLNAQAQGDLHAFNFNGQDLVALGKGDILYIGKAAPALDPYKSIGKPLSAVWSKGASDLAGTSSILVYLNIPQVKMVVEPFLGLAEMQLPGIAQAAAQGGQDPAVVEKLLTAYLEGFKTFLNEGESFYLGLTVDKAKVAGNLGVTFSSGSSLASKFGSIGGSDAKALIGGLQDKPSLFVGGMSGKPLKAMNDGTMKALVGIAGKDGKDVEEFVGQINTFLSAVDSVAFDMGFGKNGLVMTGEYVTAEPEKLAQIAANLSRGGASKFKLFMPKGDVKVDVQEKKVGGANVVEIKQTYSGLGDEEMAGIKMMFGGDSVLMQLAPKSGKLLVAVDGGENPIEKLLAGGGSLGSSAGFAKSVALLPKSLFAVGLVNVGQFGKLAKEMAERSGKPLPADVQLPESTAPIGLAAEGISSGIQLHLVVQPETVRDIVRAQGR